MTRTTTDLATSVMEDLGLLAPGETPSSRDRAYIARRYADMFDELTFENVIYWDTDEIPLEAFGGLVALMALVVERSFGFPGLTGEDFNNALDNCKRRLRRRVAKPASGNPTQSDYF